MLAVLLLVKGIYIYTCIYTILHNSGSLFVLFYLLFCFYYYIFGKLCQNVFVSSLKRESTLKYINK